MPGRHAGGEPTGFKFHYHECPVCRKIARSAYGLVCKDHPKTETIGVWVFVGPAFEADHRRTGTPLMYMN